MSDVQRANTGGAHTHLCFLLGLHKFLPVLIVLSNVHHHSRDGEELCAMQVQTCVAARHTHRHAQTHTRIHKLHDTMQDDAVEAHSCVDPLMPNSFLSKNTTVNDKSTAGCFDLKVFVNCVHVILYAVDKDLRVETSCS